MSFRPDPIRLSGLSWKPIGPGPDARVLVETHMRVASVPFRMLGFRVPMPRSAGWSANAYWEDDKALQADGLLWDVENYRMCVDRADAIPHGSTEEAELPGEQGFDRTMEDLAGGWAFLASYLGWSGKDWRPALIGGQPYILVGYPEPGGPANVPSAEAPGLAIRSSPADDGMTFNMLVEGAPCFLACASGPGESSTWLSGLERRLAVMPGYCGVAPFRGAAAAVIPADAAVWSTDPAMLAEAIGDGLQPGGSRWLFDLPNTGLDQTAAAMFEGLAMAVRRRHLSVASGQMWFASHIRDALRTLRVPKALWRSGDPRALVYDVLGKGRLIGVMVGRDGTRTVHDARILDRLFVLPETAYLGVSPMFARIAAYAKRGQVAAACGGAWIGMPTEECGIENPSWAGKLPALLDRPIKDVAVGLLSA